MRNLERSFTLTCSVLRRSLLRSSLLRHSLLLMLVLSIPALAQGEKKETLVGHWTFEAGKELEDHTGHFGDIELNGGAKVEQGQLVLGANNWAITTGYKGPDIKDKTLVAWVYIDDLDITHGAPIAINQTSADSFDAIVYAERQPRRWMAGSSNFRRTQDAVPGFEEQETGELVYMAISYEDDGGNAHVRIYRNSELIGDYTQGFMASWVAGNVEALFGIRACFIGFGGTVYGWIGQRVEDARIYGAVLSQDEIKQLRPNSLQVEACGKLATLWGMMKAK